MLNAYRIISVLPTISVVACLGLLAGCGGKSVPPGSGQETSPVQPVVEQDSNPTPEQQGKSLAEVIAEVGALDIPAGVAPVLFAELKAALVSELTAQNKARFTSVAPDIELNTVTDFEFTENPDGDNTMTWDYRNVGDYDQNSEVNVADISQLAIHYGVTEDDPGWEYAWWVDGDENGEVNVADITPIAVNYLSTISGYNVYFEDGEGVLNNIGQVGFETGEKEVSQGSGGLGFFLRHPLITAGLAASAIAIPVAVAGEGERDYTLIGPGDWRMFGRYRSHGRRSPYGGPANNHLAGRESFGIPIRSSAAIDDEGQVIFGTDGNWLQVLGDFNWYHVLSGHNGLSSPALGNDGTAYIGDITGTVYAISNRMDNAQWMPLSTTLWTYSTSSLPLTSPLVTDNGTICIGCADGRLYAFNPNGTLAWLFTTASAIYSSPATGSTDTVVFGSDDGALRSLNPDGTLRWNYNTGFAIRSSPAVVSNGTIYCGDNSGSVYAISPTGVLVWVTKIGTQILSSPAIGGHGEIYIGSDQKALYAINANGTAAWNLATEGAVNSSPAVAGNGTIYVGDMAGWFYAVNPNGTLLWRYKTSGAIESSPAIDDDGVVYVGNNDGYFYSFDGDSVSPVVVSDVQPRGGTSGDPVSFGGTYSGSSVSSYEWNFGGGATPNTSIAAAPSVTLGPVGTYAARLIVTGSDQTQATFDFDLVITPAGDEAFINDAQPQTGMSNREITLAATVSGSTPLTYFWNFGGGAVPNTSALASPTVTLGAVGEYPASLTVDNEFGDPSSFNFALVVTPGGDPVTVVSVYPTEGFEGYDVVFTFSATGTNPYTHFWDFGGGTVPNTSTEEEPTVMAVDAGEYQASLTVDNDFGDPDTFNFTLTVIQPFPAVVVDVQPQGGLEGTQITMVPEVTGTENISYSWFFDGGATPNTTSLVQPVIVLGTPGVYAASLTVGNIWGPADVFDFELTVQAIPQPVVVTDANPKTVVSGWPLTVFTATYTGTAPFTFAWDFGGGCTPNTSTDAQPMVTPLTAGSYDASVTVENDFGPPSTFPFVLVVDPAP